MRSSKISELEKIKTEFSFSLYTPVSDLYYAENPLASSDSFCLITSHMSKHEMLLVCLCCYELPESC